MRGGGHDRAQLATPTATPGIVAPSFITGDWWPSTTSATASPMLNVTNVTNRYHATAVLRPPSRGARAIGTLTVRF
jgi:hypothetical protein